MTRTTRTTRRTTLLGVGLLVAGCYAYRPVALAPAPGTQVRIVLMSATTVTTLPAAPDTVRRAYPAILEARGSIQAAAGDTIALRLSELRTAGGALSGVDGAVALIPAGRVARIEERRFQAGTTFLGGVGGVAVAGTILLVLLITSITRGF